jgi:Tfp pilus assembly protein PilF
MLLFTAGGLITEYCLRIFFTINYAISIFQNLINENKEHISARYHLAKLYMKTNKYNAAKDELEKIAQYDPENKNVAWMIKYILDDYGF